MSRFKVFFTNISLVLASLAVVGLSAISQTAKAELYIEPHVGMLVSGSSEGSVVVTSPISSTIDYKGKPSGTLFGARVGMEMMETLAFGFAYETGKVTLDFDAAGRADSETDTTSMGVFAAFEFPILLRVYASYMFSSNAEKDDVELSGSGTRIGVGFTGLPFVSINVEMYSTKLDEYEQAGVTATSDIKVDGVMVGLSVPLSF